MNGVGTTTTSIATNGGGPVGVISGTGPISGNQYRFQIVANVWGNPILTPETSTAYRAYTGEVYRYTNRVSLMRQYRREHPSIPMASPMSMPIQMFPDPVAFDPGPMAAFGGSSADPVKMQLVMVNEGSNLPPIKCFGDYNCGLPNSSLTVIDQYVVVFPINDNGFSADYQIEIEPRDPYYGNIYFSIKDPVHAQQGFSGTYQRPVGIMLDSFSFVPSQINVFSVTVPSGISGNIQFYAPTDHNGSNGFADFILNIRVP